MRPMHPENPTFRLPNRPRGVWWVCLLLVAMALANLVGAARTLWLAPDYTALGVSFPPLLAAVSGLGWGLGFLWAARRVWNGRNRSPRPVFLFVSAYGLYTLVWSRAFAVAEYARVRWPFVALATVAMVILMIWLIYRLHHRASGFERPTPDLDSCVDSDPHRSTDLEGNNCR